jgi:hypothetical protein
MAMRVNHSVKPIKTSTDPGRGEARPKPPKVGARSASLAVPRPESVHEKAKPRLTDKTVAQVISIGFRHLCWPPTQQAA